MRAFKNVGSVRPGRSVFDLSHVRTMTCDMGQLIPVMCQEMSPGDFFKFGNQSVVRMQPLVAPILHEINIYVHYFFVPYRILWDDWENFITGGKDGMFEASLPLWSPTAPFNADKYTIADYVGIPTGVDIPEDLIPIALPKMAYNLTWNEFYRDENLQSEVDLMNDEILYRNWEKDYFTSSLPWQQRGIAPALPITGITSAIFTGSIPSVDTDTMYHVGLGPSGTGDMAGAGGVPAAGFLRLSPSGSQGLKDWLNQNNVDLSSASTFDVSDLRLAFQIQKWLERNARAGVRYTEFLKAHFPVYPRDDRLQRPEYCGGSKNSIIVREVLQTSSTDTTSPQGNMSGHGISVGDNYSGKYMAQEYGVILGIMSIMPRSSYQQGVNRQWLRRTKYDFYFPEFANLSEQAVMNGELYITGNNDQDIDIFGYQGRYDELRYVPNSVHADMRDIFDYWHLSRKFSVRPFLNSDFVTCKPSKRIFAVQNEHGFIVSFSNLIKASRCMPVISEPGLIDHH